MRTRLRILIVWALAAFVVAGAAVGFAKTESHHAKDKAAAVEATESPEPDDASDEADEAKSEKEAKEAKDHERKLNHGFYVSKAAHCENVDDPATAASPDFTAPSDCKGDGNAHGKYVGSVAHSSLGKPDQSHKK